MSTGRRLTLFDCVLSGTSPKRLKITSADGNVCMDSMDSTELEEAIDSATESEGDCFYTEEIYSGDGDDRGLGGPGNHQDITINKLHGPTTIVLNAASNLSRAQSDKPRQLGEVQHQHLPSDIAYGPFEAPKQPRIKFPLHSFGIGRQRAFNVEWYKSHPWLEYSVERDAAFCYPCRVFKCGSNRSEDTFTKTGFRNWKHAMGKTGIISAHAKCETHKHAIT